MLLLSSLSIRLEKRSLEMFEWSCWATFSSLLPAELLLFDVRRHVFMFSVGVLTLLKFLMANRLLFALKLLIFKEDADVELRLEHKSSCCWLLLPLFVIEAVVVFVDDDVEKLDSLLWLMSFKLSLTALCNLFTISSCCWRKCSFCCCSVAAENPALVAASRLCDDGAIFSSPSSSSSSRASCFITATQCCWASAIE